LLNINDDNIVEGNFLGTDVTGTVALGNSFGIRIANHSANNIIGGTNPEKSNLISGNNSHGISIAGDGNSVQGNLIGKDLSGTASLLNTGAGVRADNSDNITVSDNIIYGYLYFYNANSTKITSNTISGGSYAINLLGPTSSNPSENNLIEANKIISNTQGAINLSSVANSTIVSNTIANNGKYGILLAGTSSTGTTIKRNSIYANNGLGIDLAFFSNGDGLSPNDPLDVDTGPNSLQNFPVLTSNPVINNTIEGILNSSPNTEFRIEFFTNDACDPSGNGEGKTFIASIEVTTDDDGNINFGHPLTGATLDDLFVTATATDPNGNTSEFSNCVPTAKPIVVEDDSATTDEDLSVIIPVLSNDSDPNGQALTVASVNSPGHGHATSNGTTVTYTPTLNFYGTDYFTYRATNTYGVINTATVTITVKPINDPPIFTSTPVTKVGVDETYLYNIIATDVDASDTLTITTLSIPAWITFTMKSTRTAILTGLPTSSEIGEHPVQLQVSDGLLTDTQNFWIAVRSMVQFSGSKFNVKEGESTALITVTLNTPSELTASVNYKTSGGTALPGNDYIISSGILTFTPGITTQVFDVSIMDDKQLEAIETVTLKLSNPIDAILGLPVFAMLSIIDNDSPTKQNVYIPIILK
jgi:hypothetical protein